MYRELVLIYVVKLKKCKKFYLEFPYQVQFCLHSMQLSPVQLHYQGKGPMLGIPYMCNLALVGWKPVQCMKIWIPIIKLFTLYPYNVRMSPNQNSISTTRGKIYCKELSICRSSNLSKITNGLKFQFEIPVFPALLPLNWSPN